MIPIWCRFSLCQSSIGTDFETTWREMFRTYNRIACSRPFASSSLYEGNPLLPSALGFFSNHGLVVFPGAPNDITNSRCIQTPPLLRGVVYYVFKRSLNLISSDIAVKEALSLANTLSALADSIRNSRVDVFVHNSALIYAWNEQGARLHAFSDVLKEIFKVLLFTNCILRLTYVPSTAANIADYPSRSFSLVDASLSHDIWMQLQTAFGGSLALPSNAMTDLSCNMLPFFSLYPTPGCRGVNIFTYLRHSSGSSFSSLHGCFIHHCDPRYPASSLLAMPYGK